MERVFPFFRFSGSHYQIGQEYGTACGELIRDNLDLSMRRLQGVAGATSEEILRSILEYRPFLVRYAPFLDEEIQGLSDSTGLSLEELYFLQMRAEVQTSFAGLDHENGRAECTTFGISGAGTIDRSPLAGQNADLPSFYSGICIVVKIVPDDAPSVLMVTPAGGVSYIGMNTSGLCVFANYLVCDGWRIGFPRYCLTRLALTQENVTDAERLLVDVQRASSRNILLVDTKGNILDIEFAVRGHAKLTPTGGYLVHTNHFVSPDMVNEERASPSELYNSQVRLTRLQDLIDGVYGSLDVQGLQSFLRDRQNYPNPVCIEHGDIGQADEMTVASVIAEPAHQRIWVAVGPPSRNPYKCYSFTDG